MKNLYPHHIKQKVDYKSLIYFCILLNLGFIGIIVYASIAYETTKEVCINHCLTFSNEQYPKCLDDCMEWKKIFRKNLFKNRK